MQTDLFGNEAKYTETKKCCENCGNKYVSDECICEIMHDGDYCEEFMWK